MPPKMFPQSLAEFDFKEPGEEKVFQLLKNLPDDCLVWYEVVLGVRSRKPDFMILDPHRGIIILEVKDWAKSTILGISATEVKVRGKDGTIQRQKNPCRKSRVYIDEVFEKLETDPILIGKHDKLLYPIVYFVVFPNLSEEEFTGLKADEYLEKDRVVFKNTVKNSANFIQKIQSDLPLLNPPCSQEAISAIRKHLRDEVTINSPAGGAGLLPGVLPEGEIELGEELSQDVFAIDMEQEGLAKELGDGPRLMRGIAGTGKTLIMLIRAKLLASNAEQQGRLLKILILCWNISLANYMRQAFDQINIPLKNEVTILHFSEYARRLVNNHDECMRFPRSTDPDFDTKVTRRLQQLRIRPEEKFDYVYIDEAQDFHDEWIKFIFDHILIQKEPKEKNILMCADDAQKVYKSRNFTWNSLGIPMRGDRSTVLRKIYRNSARIWGFAGFLLGDIGKYYDENAHLEFAIKRGVDPKLIECKNPGKQIDVCVKEIRNISDSGYSWRNVLILYHRVFTSGGYEIVDELIKRLHKEGIPYQWISENFEAKSTFRWAEDTVKICTATSAKGLDAPKVIILSAESFSEDEEPEYDDLKLMYVALTRAREELVVLYTGDEGLVPRLENCMDTYQNLKPKLIKLYEQ